MSEIISSRKNHISSEKIPVEQFISPADASKLVAREIADLILEKQRLNQYAVLGLATGSTPKKVYQELINIHNKQGLSFKNVITFNLDEYFPIHPGAIQSYRRFMKEVLFDHVDILPENCHVPDGTVSVSDLKLYCDLYEQKIEAAGGIDFQLARNWQERTYCI